MSTLRLVFFDFNNNYGGAPQTSVLLAQWLNKTNEVQIIDAYGRCKPYIDAIRNAGLPCHVLLPESKITYIGNKGKPIARLASLMKQLPDLIRLRSHLIKKILEIDPDVIWANSEKPLFFLSSSFRLRHYPLVAFHHGQATPDQINTRYRWLLKRKASAVMTVSKTTATNLKMAGIPEHKLNVVANAIDIETFEQKAKQVLKIPVPGMNMRPKILLNAARPELKKGHMTAVKALSHLKKKGHNPALWIPGKVAVGVDKSFVDELKNTISELNLQDNVFFLGWRQDMPQLINASDIVILPTHTEGLSLAIEEAMLLRRLVISTPISGVTDLITDGETGFLVPIDDDKALANKIENVISNSTGTAEIIEKAHKFIKNNFSPEAYAKKVTKVLSSAVG